MDGPSTHLSFCWRSKPAPLPALGEHERARPLRERPVFYQCLSLCAESAEVCSALTKCPAPVGASTRTLQCGLTAQTGRECHISENGDSHLGFSPRELFLLTPGTSDLRIPNVPWPKQDQHYRNTRIKCTSSTTWSHGTTASPGAHDTSVRAKHGGRSGGSYHQSWTSHPGTRPRGPHQRQPFGFSFCS